MMKRNTALFSLVVACLSCLLLYQGCVRSGLVQQGSESLAEKDVVSVYVTEDFGRVVLKEAVVNNGKDGTVMDALEKVCRVEKAYGGGFVESIDGISSTNGKDWFYYVNGTLADVGAALYETCGNDDIWWDYHSWNGDNFIGAVVGSYPRPFTVGYGGKRRPTTIVSGSRFEGEAKAIGEYLGALNARIYYSKEFQKIDEFKKKGPVIVFVDREVLNSGDKGNIILKYLNTGGTFIRVQGNTVVPLDERGKPSGEGVGVAGAVVSSGVGMGDSSPVWLLLLFDDQMRGKIVKILTDDSHVLRHKVGVLIDGKCKIRSLPLR